MVEGRGILVGRSSTNKARRDDGFQFGGQPVSLVALLGEITGHRDFISLVARIWGWENEFSILCLVEIEKQKKSWCFQISVPENMGIFKRVFGVIIFGN